MSKSRAVSIVLPALLAIPLGLLAVGLAWPQAAPKVEASRLAGIQGAGATGMQCQNLDASQAMTLVVDFYNQSGGAPVSVLRAAVPAGFAANLYLPNEPTLRNGAYAAIASADRALDCLSRTDWSSSGGSIMANASLPGTEIIVPGVVKQHDFRTSLISIQNTDTGLQARVEMSLYAGTPNPLATVTLSPVMPGTSTTIDLGRSAAFAAVPPGTLGHVRIESSSPIAVQHIVDVENSQKGVYAFEGLPLEAASSTLFAPLIHSEASADGSGRLAARFNSEWHLVNPGSADVQVDVSYRGTAGSCAGQTFRQGPIVIGAGRDAVLSHVPTRGGPLPAGCTASAVLEARGGEVLGAVVDFAPAQGIAGAYTSFSQDDGGSPVYLPLFRRNHTNLGLSTAVQVMNLGNQATTVTLNLWDSSGQHRVCAACRVDLDPQHGHAFWPDDLVEFPDKTFGAARVDADQALAIVVADVSAINATDLGIYTGLAAQDSLQPGPRDVMTSYSPLLLTEGGFAPTTSSTPPYPPPATATPDASPTAVATAPSPTALAATATPLALASPTPVPPTDVPSPTALPFNVSDEARRGVPAAVLAAALQNPASINGWGQPRNPNQPPGPFNPPRTCLTLLDPGKAWHPLFNPLVFKAGCP